MTNKKTLAGYIVNFIICLVLVVFAALASSMGMLPKTSTMIWQCCYFIILACSLNLVLGFLGQLSLGHCGFMAVGAYSAALISLAFQRAGFYTDKSGPEFMLVLLICIVAAGVLAAIVGLIVGIPALRLKGDYLAIITLGFGMIIVNVINNLPFCGMDGLALGSASSALYQNGLGFVLHQLTEYLWLPVLLVVVCVALMFAFIRSKYGRTIKAIRDNEIAAGASGVNVSYYKVLTFVLGAFFAGIAGAIFACCNSSLTTGSFSFTSSSILNSTFIVVMVVVGGMGSLTGSAVSAVGMFLLNYTIKNGKWVEALPNFVQQIFAYPMLVYSIALIIVIIFRPKGIFGTYEFSVVKFVTGIPAWPAYFKKKFSGKNAEEVAGNE